VFEIFAKKYRHGMFRGDDCYFENALDIISV